MTKTILLSAIALMLAGTAAAAQPAPGVKVTVEGNFTDEEDANVEISGIACSSPPGESARACLVALDEGLAAQWVTLMLSPTPTLTVGEPATLFDESADTPELRKGIPETSCSAGEGNFNEHDTEGVAFEGGNFILAGSHGCGRNRQRFKASAFVDVRLSEDAGSAPVLSSGLNSILHELPELKAAYGLDTQTGEGISIEGVAAASGKLFFGLRSPVLADGAAIVEVGADALFSGKEGDAPLLHFAELEGMGIRDLAALDSDPPRLLILAGPKSGGDGPFSVVLFTPNPDGGTGTATPVQELTTEGDAKAEALLVAARNGSDVKVLVMHDSILDGEPRLHDLVLP